MSRFSLKVEIAADDLKIVKAGKNNVCLIKCINYQSKDIQGNVVFMDALTKDLAPGLVFRWEERHQVHMTYDFQEDTLPVPHGMAALSNEGEQVKVPTGSITNTHLVQQVMTAEIDGIAQTPTQYAASHIQAGMTAVFDGGIVEAPAEAITNIYDIQQGMLADFDEDGNAKVTGSPDVTKPIVVWNHWKSGGSIALAVYDPTTRKFTTTFVSPPTLIKYSYDLTPTEQIGVFFHTRYATNAVLDPTKIEVFTVNLKGKESATVRYEGGNWKIID